MDDLDFNVKIENTSNQGSNSKLASSNNIIGKRQRLDKKNNVKFANSINPNTEISFPVHKKLKAKNFENSEFSKIQQKFTENMIQINEKKQIKQEFHLDQLDENDWEANLKTRLSTTKLKNNNVNPNEPNDEKKIPREFKLSKKSTLKNELKRIKNFQRLGVYWNSKSPNSKSKLSIRPSNYRKDYIIID